MILNRLLYSRSFSKDYRWVIVPSAESPGDQENIKLLLDQLNDEYDLYDRSKGVGSERDAILLFSKSVGGYGVLCRCGPTKYEDALGRKIFALSGLVARHEEQKEFAAALPYLVALGGECLDIPVDLGAADADRIKNSVSTESIALERLREKLPATAREWLRMPHIQGMAPHDLRSEDDGLKCLLRLLGSPLVPWVDFAFATPAQLARRMGTCDVVVGEVGLSIAGVEPAVASRVPPPPRPAPDTTSEAEPERAGGKKPRRKKKHDATRGRSRKRGAGAKPSDSTRDFPSTKKSTERHGRRGAPILPDDFAESRRPDTEDDDDTIRIRAVTDSSYLERVLHRIYFRFEAYGTGGYVAGESERFRLSLNLERDHVVQKKALSGLLDDLHDRGYVHADGNEKDWSECVLRRKGEGASRFSRGAVLGS